MEGICFIVGSGRCGTTILGRVLNSHSKVCVPHELQFIVGNAGKEALYEKYVSGEMRGFDSDDFAVLMKNLCPYHFDKYFDYENYLKGLEYPQSDLRKFLLDFFNEICEFQGKSIFIEQTPWHGKKIDVLNQLFPEAKFIHVVRDGRDVATSYARTPWWTNDVSANLLMWSDSINTINDFLIDSSVSSLVVRYEDLVIDSEFELSRIMTFLGLELEEEMLNPDCLIDYSRFFKQRSLDYQSDNNKNWDKDMSNVFFPDSVYSWKQSNGGVYANLPAQVQDVLRSLNYEV